MKDLKPWVLLQLQYKKKTEEGKKKKRNEFLVLTPFAWVVKLEKCLRYCIKGTVPKFCPNSCLSLTYYKSKQVTDPCTHGRISHSYVFEFTMV